MLSSSSRAKLVGIFNYFSVWCMRFMHYEASTYSSRRPLESSLRPRKKSASWLKRYYNPIRAFTRRKKRAMLSALISQARKMNPGSRALMLLTALHEQSSLLLALRKTCWNLLFLHAECRERAKHAVHLHRFFLLVPHRNTCFCANIKITLSI